MRTLRLLMVLSVGAGCSGKEHGAVRAVLQFDGFHPGCLQLTAVDRSNRAHSSSVTLELEPGVEAGTAVVAVYEGAGWSTNLELIAQARETDCQGATVAQQTHEAAIDQPEVVEVTFALHATDADHDGFIDADPAQALPGTDCDDRDGTRYPTAAEICNQADNDCNGAVDDAAECQGAHWVAQTVLVGASDVWRTVSSIGRGQAWLAGDASALIRRNANGTFLSVGLVGPCAGDKRSSWADPGGRVMLGDSSGAVVSHAFLSDGDCRVELQAPGGAVAGLTGVPIDGSTALLAVTEKGSITRLPLAGGAGIAEGQFNAALFDVHGVSAAATFAVGLDRETGNSIILQRGSTGWASQPHPAILGGHLNGVWVVNDHLAYAVGDRATALMWNGAAWSKLPSPAGESVAVTSVVAFGPSSVYVADSAATIRRWNGGQWQLLEDASALTQGGALYDLGGSGPDDLWAVGEHGVVVHWFER